MAQYGVFKDGAGKIKVFPTKAKARKFYNAQWKKWVKIYGNGRSSPYWIEEIEVKNNPSVPKGKFIKCKAVKLNRNGSISIKK